MEQSVENIFKVEKKSFMSQKFSTKQHAKHTRQLFQRIGLWHFGNSTLRLKHFNSRHRQEPNVMCRCWWFQTSLLSKHLRECLPFSQWKRHYNCFIVTLKTIKVYVLIIGSILLNNLNNKWGWQRSKSREAPKKKSKTKFYKPPAAKG